MDESIYVRLRTDPQWRNELESAPLVIAYTFSPQLGEAPFTLLGIDPFAEAPFRSYMGQGQQTPLGSIASLLTVPGSILLSAPTANQYGLKPCSPSALTDACQLTLSIDGQARHAYLTGLLEPSDELSRRALETLIVTDLATAQSLTGTVGNSNRPDPSRGFDTARLSSSLPAGTRLITLSERNNQVTEMTAAFRINLTALESAGVSCWYLPDLQRDDLSVVQRRSLFGTLRSIGYTREQIFGMVLGKRAGRCAGFRAGVDWAFSLIKNGADGDTDHQ